MMSKTGEIRRDETCLDYGQGTVILYSCHGGKGNQVTKVTLALLLQRWQRKPGNQDNVGSTPATVARETR